MREVNSMTYKQALNILYTKTAVEVVLEYHETPDFWEFVGDSGGDVHRYRVYKETSKIYVK